MMKSLKNIKRFAAKAAVVLLFAAGAVGCADDPINTIISGTPESVSFPYTSWDSRTMEISVVGADSWEVAEKPDWIEAELEGNILTLTALQNPSFAERRGNVVIKANGTGKAISVIQHGDPAVFVYFSPESVTFPADSWVPQTVEIALKESGDWEVVSQPEWIETESDGNMLTVTARSNDTFRRRTGEIAIRSNGIGRAITVTQNDRVPSVETVETGGIPAYAVSSNGRYIVGTRGTVGFIYDRANKERTIVGSGTEAVDPGDPNVTAYLLYDVSDTGIVTGTAQENGGSYKPFLWDSDSGEFVWLDMNIGLAGRTAASGQGMSISADGTVIAGNVSFPEGTDHRSLVVPVIWRNKEVQVLGYDTSELLNSVVVHGCSANSISADGSIVVGWVETRYNQRVGCYWNLEAPDNIEYILTDDPEYYLAEEFLTENYGNQMLPVKYIRPEQISPNGKIITGSFLDESTGMVGYSPISYDPETGEATLVEPGYNAYGTFSTPSGVMAYTRRQDAGAYDVSFYDNGQMSSMSNWLRVQHGVEISTDGRYDIRDVSLDGNTMVGNEIMSGGIYRPYIISL